MFAKIALMAAAAAFLFSTVSATYAAPKNRQVLSPDSATYAAPKDQRISESGAEWWQSKANAEGNGDIYRR